MSIKKQKDVIQDITEQTLLTLDGVAEEITKQSIQEEVDNFIADRSLKDNQKEVIAIANKVAEFKKGDKTNFGVVVDVSASSITFKGKDLPKTKIVFNQRKMGSKDYVLSALRKMNEGIDTGDIYYQQEFSLKGNLNQIFSKLTEIGINLSLRLLTERKIPVAQNHSLATFFKRRKPEESEITIEELRTMPARYLYDKIRMLADPYPNAYFNTIDKKKIFFKIVDLNDDWNVLTSLLNKRYNIFENFIFIYK